MIFRVSGSDAKSTLIDSDSVVNIKGIRKQNLPYIIIWVIYYAWVIAFATWWTDSPLNENVFSTQLRNLLHSLNLISSTIVIFFIKKHRFLTLSRVGAVSVVCGMILYTAIHTPAVQLLSTIIIGISLGFVNIGILMPFAFTMNNTERLYSAVGSNVLISIMMLIANRRPEHALKTNIEMFLSFVILLGSLCSIVFFKKDAVLSEKEKEAIGANLTYTNETKMTPRIYLALVINCVYVILCKGVGKGIFNIVAEQSGHSLFTLYYIGGIIGCIAYFVIYAFAKKANIWAGNFTFACVVMGLMFNAFSDKIPGMASVFALFIGIASTAGMINVYYIIGVIGNKYNSMHYLRMSIFFIGITGGISGIVVGNLIQRINTCELSVIATIISAFILLLFMTLSPSLSKELYYNDWARDSELIDVDNDMDYLFKKYDLSKRELEVCKLLLQGFTLRQISAMLSIAYSTVNTYCTSIYRKLGINSRTELLIMFKDYSSN